MTRANRGFCERGLTRAQAPLQDIYVCTADLEDGLIRALGTAEVEEILRAEGAASVPGSPSSVGPHNRAGPGISRVRFFLGTKQGRTIRYGRLLVEALVPGRTPPLGGLLASL